MRPVQRKILSRSTCSVYQRKIEEEKKQEEKQQKLKEEEKVTAAERKQEMDVGSGIAKKGQEISRTDPLYFYINGASKCCLSGPNGAEMKNKEM